MFDLLRSQILKRISLTEDEFERTVCRHLLFVERGCRRRSSMNGNGE
jgi:hypothetical protein